MSQQTVIYWFRQDLRLSDNPALTQAGAHNKVLPIYILDDNAGRYAMGDASLCWLYHSLTALNTSLNDKLSIYRGNPQYILDELILRFTAKIVYWNRCYEPWCINRDDSIRKHLKIQGIEVYTFNGSLLWEPWDIKNNSNTPYKIFTSFYRKGCLTAKAPRIPLQKINGVKFISDKSQRCINLIDLMPKIKLSKQFLLYWNAGEIGAHKRLKQFITTGLKDYKNGRNFPSKSYTSRLSPHLHFGELSPNQLWYYLKNISDNEHIDHFCSELGWREFSYNQLYYNPELSYKNLKSKFNHFPWINNSYYLHAWQIGQTGIPMIDAGMRELWQTGYMHNRLRMIVGSFLVKNLKLHWRHGERWFWNMLVDADLANNSANWQWIAGCGSDPVPYFRIFNPVIQGRKYDPDGNYIRTYIPEIATLPDKYIFTPWDAPYSLLQKINIKLGITYPQPIINLKKSRESALKAFQALR